MIGKLLRAGYGHGGGNDGARAGVGASRQIPFRVPRLNIVGIVAIVLAATLITVKSLHGHTSSNEILNVSYDPTRELYATLDKAFVEQFRRQTGTTLKIKQSHGGSGRQVSDVIDGRHKANVV